MAMLLAGVLRAVLSDRTIGVLAVRGKKFDLLFYFAAAACHGRARRSVSPADSRTSAVRQVLGRITPSRPAW